MNLWRRQAPERDVLLHPSGVSVFVWKGAACALIVAFLEVLV